MQSKSTLRLHYQAQRDRIAPAERAAANIAILQHLLSLSIYEQAESVLIYCAFRSEVETMDIASRAFDANKKVFAPRLTNQKGNMEVAPIQSAEDLLPGAFGIPEPKPSIQAVAAYPFDLILIPGLAFDRQGFRLGYGGGYYDRFLQLPQTEGYCIGLAYQLQITNVLPREPFDQPIDGVITEKGFYPTPFE